MKTSSNFLIALGLAIMATTATAFLLPVGPKASCSTSSTLIKNVSSFMRSPMKLQATAKVGSEVPSGVMVDVITKEESNEMDFGEILKSHKKCVLFAVPGAFTPTCSLKHLPGFIAKMDEFKRAGVDEVYCMSVNDRFVMKAWGESTENCLDSGIKLVADGNCEYTKALDLVKDASGGRMQLRTQRFAAVIENGKFTTLNVDEAGLDSSAAEVILDALKVSA